MQLLMVTTSHAVGGPHWKHMSLEVAQHAATHGLAASPPFMLSVCPQ